MCQLMTYYVKRDGEAVEYSLVRWKIFIAIAIDHLLTIPKGVVIAPLVMYGGINPHTTSINGISLINIIVKIIRHTATIKSFIDGHICAGRIVFPARNHAG